MKDSWVEETGIKEGFFIAAGVRPSEVSGGEISESFRLVVTRQLARPIVKGCVDVCKVQGKGCEDQAIASARVPSGSLVFIDSDLGRQK